MLLATVFGQSGHILRAHQHRPQVSADTATCWHPGRGRQECHRPNFQVCGEGGMGTYEKRGAERCKAHAGTCGCLEKDAPPPPPEAHTGATRMHRETVGGAHKKLAASGERVSAWRGRCTSHVYPWHGLSCFKPHVSFPTKQQNPTNQSQKVANSTAEIL